MHFLAGTGTASIRVKDINDMPPQFTKDEWFTEVDETEGPDLPEMPILTVTVHDEDETNKFQYKVSSYIREAKFLIDFRNRTIKIKCKSSSSFVFHSKFALTVI